jgi:hypothetical protein
LDENLREKPKKSWIYSVKIFIKKVKRISSSKRRGKSELEDLEKSFENNHSFWQKKL